MTDYIIITLMLLIAAQTTYLVVQRPQRTARSNGKDLIFVDTSVLIDGRIIEVASTGFVPGTLAIPRSVIAELQLLADQADHEKRARARHGLDIVVQLQAISTVQVQIYNDGPLTTGVDDRLLELARKHDGTICTIDFNLIKVAKVHNLRVLNINDLAKTLRMAFLPGERTTLELTQKGNDHHQAVGHLADGTMVVVEQASGLIGKPVSVEFIRSLQTAAGRMMFAKLVDPPAMAAPRQVNPSKKTRGPIVTPATSSRPSEPQPRPVKASSKPQPRPASKRRRTNEDRLVDLANGS